MYLVLFLFLGTLKFVLRVPNVPNVVFLRAIRNRAFERFSHCLLSSPFLFGIELSSFVSNFLELLYDLLDSFLIYSTFILELLKFPLKLLDPLY